MRAALVRLPTFCRCAVSGNTSPILSINCLNDPESYTLLLTLFCSFSDTISFYLPLLHYCAVEESVGPQLMLFDYIFEYFGRAGRVIRS